MIGESQTHFIPNVKLSDVETETFYHFIEHFSSFWLCLILAFLRCVAAINVWVASPHLLTAVSKCLGSEESSCWSFRRGMLSRLCLFVLTFVTRAGTWRCWETLCLALRSDSAYNTWIMRSKYGEDGENALVIAASTELHLLAEAM